MKRKLKSINEFKEILKNPSPNLKVPVYDEDKKGRGKIVRNTKGNRFTLAMLAEKIDCLANDLRSEMNTGFKQVNTRLDRIETRLDYIVKANSLKDLPGK